MCNNNTSTSSAVIVLVLFVLLIIIFRSLNGNNLTDSEKFKNEYEFYNGKKATQLLYYPEVNISRDNIMKYASIKEIFDIFENKDDAVVYFGYANCPACRHVVQLLLDTAKDSKLDVIHYIDIDEYWDVKTFNNDNNLVTIGGNNSTNQTITIDGETYKLRGVTKSSNYYKLDSQSIIGYGSWYK